MVYVETGDTRISRDNSKGCRGVRKTTIGSEESEWTPLPNLASDWIKFRSEGFSNTSLLNQYNNSSTWTLINLKQNDSVGFSISRAVTWQKVYLNYRPKLATLMRHTDMKHVQRYSYEKFPLNSVKYIGCLCISTNEGLGLKEWGVSAQVPLSAFNGNPPLQTGEITSSKRHPTGREILVTACCSPGNAKGS